jgi:hypothetical protein
MTPERSLTSRTTVTADNTIKKLILNRRTSESTVWRLTVPEYPNYQLELRGNFSWEFVTPSGYYKGLQTIVHSNIDDPWNDNDFNALNDLLQTIASDHRLHIVQE